MHHFHAFGGVLRSALRFPELRPSGPAPADWTLSVGAPQPFAAGAEVLGAQRYPGEVDVRLLRDGARLRIETSDIGDFDIEPTSQIVWRPLPGSTEEWTRAEEWARFDLLGRVLPVALHVSGRLVLHGSSVVMPDGRAIAFLAPKGRGKSTLALALAQRGARLLSDDVTLLEESYGGWLVRPGVHSVRLWDDAVRLLSADAYGELGSVGRKRVVQEVPDSLRADEGAPLGAVYLITGNTPEHGAVASRRALGARDGALGLVRQATAGSLLGGAEGARLLARAASVARQVPVHALDVAYDFARLEELVRQLKRWPRESGAWSGGVAESVPELAAGGAR